MVTTPGQGQRSGSVYCVWTRSAPTLPSSRGSDQAIRSSWFGVSSSIASMPAGTSSGCRVTAAMRSPAAAAGSGSSRSRLRT